MNRLTRHEVENDVKVGDVIALVRFQDGEMSEVLDYHKRTVFSIIKNDNGSVVIRTIHKYFGRDMKEFTGKSKLSSSRMTKAGKIHLHSSGCSYELGVIKIASENEKS